jgi:fatty-acyl-CoA synthase
MVFVIHHMVCSPDSMATTVAAEVLRVSDEMFGSTSGGMSAVRARAVRLPGGGHHWVDQLARHAFQTPGRTALVFEGAETTWGQLQQRVHALAGVLAAECGVCEGDRVAVLMTNRPQFLDVLLAVNSLRAIAVPVNFRLAAAEVAFILADSGAVALAVDQELAPLAAQVRESLHGGASVLVTGPDPEAAGPGALSLDALIAEPAREYPVVEIDEHDAAMIMYTSGTTGRPKGAVLAHSNIGTMVPTLSRIFRLGHDDDTLAVAVPMFHVAAMSMVYPAITLGSRTVLLPTGQFDPEALLDIVERERVTALFLVPAQWQAMVEVPDAGRRAASLRVLCWGAAPATVSLLQEMSGAFPGVANASVFGQTEMSSVTTVLDGEDAIDRMGSVGRPIPHVRVRIVDDAMNDVPQGEVGEIVYRGQGLMAGYWNQPKATAEAMEGGWFHSGDLVRMDEEGFIYVVDRKKDMIISGGENVYCAEVEDVLAGHPGVADVAVIGAAHKRWGETPVAVVVPADPAAPPTLDDLTEWCRPRLASYKKPTQLLVLDALPRNASGKVFKPQLRRMLHPTQTV